MLDVEETIPCLRLQTVLFILREKEETGSRFLFFRQKIKKSRAVAFIVIALCFTFKIETISELEE